MENSMFNLLKQEILASSEINDTFRQIRELNEIRLQKVKDIQEKEWERARIEKIAALKALKPRTTVYSRFTGELFGKPLLKVKDGKTHMHVVGNGGKHWRVPYTGLQTEPLNEIEKWAGKLW